MASPQYPRQVCLTFGLDGKYQRSMRLSSDDPPGLYIALWDSARVPHGAALLGAESRSVPIPFLPWAAVKTGSLDQASKAMWLQERVLGIMLPARAAKVEELQKALARDLDDIGGPVSCSCLGMLRGGGIAHATFATGLRTHPGLEEVYRRGWGIAFGVAPPCKMVQCWDAVLHSLDDGKFQGNPAHADAKGDSFLQCEIILWPLPPPPARGGPNRLRIGVITAFKEVTAMTVKNLLLSFACRQTMMESSALHRLGPKSRPAPPRVLGGPCVKRAEAEKWTADQLLAYVTRNCQNRVLIAQAHEAMKALEPPPCGRNPAPHWRKQLEALFPPLPAAADFAELYPTTAADQRRSLILRGLLGGVSQYEMRQCGASAGAASDGALRLRKCDEAHGIAPAKWWADLSGQTPPAGVGGKTSVQSCWGVPRRPRNIPHCQSHLSLCWGSPRPPPPAPASGCIP